MNHFLSKKTVKSLPNEQMLLRWSIEFWKKYETSLVLHEVKAHANKGSHIALKRVSKNLYIFNKSGIMLHFFKMCKMDRLC